MRIKVTLADGRELEAPDAAEKTSDLIRFEREYKMSAAALATESIRTEWLAFFAWTALRRKGSLDDMAFDIFADTVEELEVLEEAPVPKEASDQEAPPE